MLFSEWELVQSARKVHDIKCACKVITNDMLTESNKSTHLTSHYLKGKKLYIILSKEKEMKNAICCKLGKKTTRQNTFFVVS